MDGVESADHRTAVGRLPGGGAHHSDDFPCRVQHRAAAVSRIHGGVHFQVASVAFGAEVGDLRQNAGVGLGGTHGAFESDAAAGIAQGQERHGDIAAGYIAQGQRGGAVRQGRPGGVVGEQGHIPAGIPPGDRGDESRGGGLAHDDLFLIGHHMGGGYDAARFQQPAGAVLPVEAARSVDGVDVENGRPDPPVDGVAVGRGGDAGQGGVHGPPDAGVQCAVGRAAGGQGEQQRCRQRRHGQCFQCHCRH